MRIYHVKMDHRISLIKHFCPFKDDFLCNVSSQLLRFWFPLPLCQIHSLSLSLPTPLLSHNFDEVSTRLCRPSAQADGKHWNIRANIIIS